MAWYGMRTLPNPLLFVYRVVREGSQLKMNETLKADHTRPLPSKQTARIGNA